MARCNGHHMFHKWGDWQKTMLEWSPGPLGVLISGGQIRASVEEGLARECKRCGLEQLKTMVTK